MTDHNRLLGSLKDETFDVLNPRWVDQHRDDYRGAFLDRHRRQAKEVAAKGRAAREAIAPRLLHRISDERTIRTAFDHLRLHGGRAPGPDRFRYGDLPNEHYVWKFCRQLRDTIRGGKYVPGPERVKWIEKDSGNGERPLVLQCIHDRVIQRAVVEVVQPLLDPLFSDHCLGYRPKMGRLHALALAERYYVEEGKRVWVTEDIRDAFLNVPIPRLLEVLKKHLIATDVVKFIGRVLSRPVLSGPETSGLRQGGPLSPLLLNLFLHHFLDRPWLKKHPDVPMIRVADDLLLLCDSVEQAQQARGTLADLVEKAGMALKGTAETTIRRVTADEPAKWLGYSIREGKNNLWYNLTKQGWRRLERHLLAAQSEVNPSGKASAVVKGWLSEQGPAYREDAIPKAAKRLRRLSVEAGLGEIMGLLEFKNHWAGGFIRWCKLRKV